MKFKYFFFITFTALNAFCQDGFQWNSKKSKIVIPFQSVANLVIIPVQINHVKLNMLLDTGAESSMIFSLPENDSIVFSNTQKVKIKGLGSEEPFEALYSGGNTIDISGYKNSKFPLLIVLNQDVNISAKLGIEVNGILNNSFFKNKIIEINYDKKKLTLYEDRKILEKKKIKGYEKIPIRIIKDRPYVTVETKIDDTEMNLNLLIDMGLSDGLWLFENDSIKIKTANFEDNLGKGLSGTIIGKRSRVNHISISNFDFSEALVSYPYKEYFPKMGSADGRNGSLGGGIFHRFSVIFDYQKKQMFLKPNAKFSDPFNYNMSGMEIQHNGIEFVKEIMRSTDNKTNATEDVSHLIKGGGSLLYKFSLKPVFEISTVRKNSPAHLAGILPGDKITKINNKNIHRFTLQKITELLQSQEGKWIYIDVIRNGYEISFKFQLQKII